MRSMIEKITIVSGAKAKAPHTKFVMYPKKVVGFDQPPLWICNTSTLITLQATFHQHSPPSVWTRISKQTECLSMRRMLPPSIETQARIQRNSRYLLIRHYARIELELKNFLTPSCMGV